MKRAAKTVALSVLAVLSLVWLTLISVQGPQAIRTAWEVLRVKVSGRAPYVTWGQVLFYAVPSALHPSWMIPIQNLEACLRVPVRILKEKGGACGVQWETPLGSFWASRDEGHLLAHLVHEELWGAVYNRPPVAVKRGDVVIDGGAHVGTFTRFALGKGARKVIAFEPDPQNVECLKQTFGEELAQGKLVVVEKALWSSSGNLKLRRRDNTAQSWVTERTQGPGDSVQATTIDDAVEELQLNRVDFIKLDIEGAERLALAGAAQTLRRFGPRMVVCTYHLPDDPVKITETVLRLRPSYWVFATAEQACFYEGARDLR